MHSLHHLGTRSGHGLDLFLLSMSKSVKDAQVAPLLDAFKVRETEPSPDLTQPWLCKGISLGDENHQIAAFRGLLRLGLRDLRVGRDS